MPAGFGPTPLALAIAPFATQFKTLLVAMAAATSIVTIKVQIFESPRGLIFIDAQTLYIAQNVFICRAEPSRAEPSA